MVTAGKETEGDTDDVHVVTGRVATATATDDNGAGFSEVTGEVMAGVIVKVKVEVEIAPLADVGVDDNIAADDEAAGFSEMIGGLITGVKVKVVVAVAPLADVGVDTTAALDEVKAAAGRVTTGVADVAAGVDVAAEEAEEAGCALAAEKGFAGAGLGACVCVLFTFFFCASVTSDITFSSDGTDDSLKNSRILLSTKSAICVTELHGCSC